jgi:Amt family ammonium transporter
LRKKADFGAGLNGVLGGLVGITANADWVTSGQAFIIGFVAGIIVVLVMLLLERLKIDDAVGAVPVHGGAGVWAGIATAIFGANANWTAQIVGTVVYPLFAFIFAFAVFSILKAVRFLRVSPEDEETGLDLSEHGNRGYVITGLNPSAGD